MSSSAQGPRVWAALITVYVLWGSTYLGILFAIRTIPPFLMLAARFGTAGLLLFAWSISRGDRAGDRPGWKQWRAAAIVGGALLLAGNGSVAWSEQHLTSGVASLIVATTPLFFALFDRIATGASLTGTAMVGLAIGLVGAGILANPFGSGHVDPLAAGVLLLGVIAWAGGSLYARKAALPSRPLVGASMEMLVAGAGFTVLALATGEPAQTHSVSSGSLIALLYLIVFGSLVGFTAYVWLLRNAKTSLVSTYAYVNPAIAVFLGWALVNEPIGPRMFVAGGMILVAVMLILGAKPKRPKPRLRPALAAIRAR